MLKDLMSGVIDEKEYFAINNVTVIYDKLSKNIHGWIKRIDGINLICIKRSLSEKKKKETLLHELAHLELNHLEKRKELSAYCIKDLEDEADEYIKLLRNQSIVITSETI